MSTVDYGIQTFTHLAKVGWKGISGPLRIRTTRYALGLGVAENKLLRRVTLMIVMVYKRNKIKPVLS